MKIALCLFGMSHNFHRVAENIQTNIISSLHIEDIYISTYKHHRYDEMINQLKPTFVANPPDAHNGFQMVKNHNLLLLNALHESEKEYDWIIVSRLDASYDYDFAKLFKEKKILENPNTFFHLCWCETQKHIDDMLWIFPMSQIKQVISALDMMNKARAWTHDMHIFLEKNGIVYQHLFDGFFTLRVSRPFIKFAREM